GKYDIAVNGGGLFTVVYEKPGHLPSQRQIEVPWQHFVMAPDVAMTLHDPQVTRIDLSASTPIQIAQGSEVNDQDGSRRAVLFFRQGTTATMKLPGGAMQPLTTMHVRISEYTVGPNGPEAMPAELSTTSAYTYAVEFNADEAVAAGASNIFFSQPVIFYQDNFLGFPTGMAVPSGFYDRELVDLSISF
ncbi:MAG TPA: hypothetical protein VFQ92_23020, partial [Blastocatellia bacterium]|nr:hypothetical protein [Blastocatellia bacterium]